MSDKLEEVAQLLSRKHGISIGRDDPILMLHTMNEKIKQDNEDQQKKLLKEFQSQLQEIIQNWSEEAKYKAESIINEALRATQEEMRKEAEQATKNISENITNEITYGYEKLADSIQQTRYLTIMNMIIASLTIIATLVVVLKYR
ncbi:hypothetical protein [Bartonella sp. DGB2]|uniref:hypothetical protein n=1 Tax=Bartonella sp. DGB2 TaxID=3388426 RepID=UPI00398FDC2D